MSMDLEAWRCSRDDNLFCPPEGCAKSYGCARDKGWLPGMPTPDGCDGRFSAGAFFDIRDTRNVYEPCPKCRATVGLGLTSKQRKLFVHCATCGHTGPAIEVPTLEQWDSWPIPWHERDRLAFEAWNKASNLGAKAG